MVSEIDQLLLYEVSGCKSTKGEDFWETYFDYGESEKYKVLNLRQSTNRKFKRFEKIEMSIGQESCFSDLDLEVTKTVGIQNIIVKDSDSKVDLNAKLPEGPRGLAQDEENLSVLD